jgi:hypothetical protein
MWSQRLPVHGSVEGLALLPTQNYQIKIDLASLSAEPMISAVLTDLTTKRLEERDAALAPTTLEQLSCGAATTRVPLTERRRRDPSQWCGHGSLKAHRH